MSLINNPNIFCENDHSVTTAGVPWDGVCVWCMWRVCVVLELLVCIIVYYFKGIYIYIYACIYVLLYYGIASCEALRTYMDLCHTNAVLKD